MLAMNVLFPFFMMLAVIAHQSCPLSPSEQSQILSDQLQLMSNSKSETNTNLSYQYTYNTRLYEKPEVVIGINNFNAEPSSVLGVEVRIKELNETQANFQIVMNYNGRWKQMSVNFLSSTRSDLELGIAKYEKVRPTPIQSFQIEYLMKRKWSTPYLKIKSLLSSFHLTSSNHLNLGVSLQHTQTSNQTITLFFIANNTLVYNVEVNIIIFDAHNPSFRYLEGQIAQNYLRSKLMLEIPHKKIQQLRTFIVGFIGFFVEVNAPISLFTGMNRLFYLEIGPEQEGCYVNHLTIGYLILSVYEGCGACEGYDYLYDGECLKECPTGYLPKQGECQEIDCQTGYFWDKALEKCAKCPTDKQIPQCPPICPYGQQLVNGQCQSRCPTNQVFEFNKCVCKAGLYRIDGVCGSCPAGTRWASSSQSCISVCGRFAEWKYGKCICLPGYYLISGYCQKCQLPEVYNKEWKECLIPCPEHQEYDGVSCVCSEGYFMIEGECDRCPPGTIYSFINQNCRPNCQENQQYNGVECECIGDYVRINEQCYPPCGANQEYKGLLCICKEGYDRIDGRCDICDKGYVYDPAISSCRKECGQYQAYDGVSCVCIRGFVMNNGVCRPECAQYEKYDEYVGKCVCIGGYMRINNDKCIPECGQNQQYKHGQCVCIDGYDRILGRCGVCVSGYVYDPSTEKCLPTCGPNQQWTGSHCQCVSGYLRIGKQCSTCPSNTTYNSSTQHCDIKCNQNQYLFKGQCICRDGYKLSASGTCIPKCGVYSFYDDVSDCCICIDGYYKHPQTGQCIQIPPCEGNLIKVNGICECPTGMYLNEASNNCFVCDGKKEMKDGKCVCRSGYIVESDGCRLPCNENEQFIMGVCACKNGYEKIKGTCKKIQTCMQNAYWNGEKCQCQTGYTLNNGICCQITPPPTDCWYNSYFDGVKCVCKKGFFQFMEGVCATCPPRQKWNGKKCAYDSSCWPGYVWDQEEECCVEKQQLCGNNSRWNGHECVCLDQYNFIDGRCQVCGFGTRYDGLQCSPTLSSLHCLKANEIMIGGRCVCQQNMYRFKQECISCPSGTTWSGSFCQGVKSASPCHHIPHSSLINGNCECITGYEWNNGHCEEAYFGSYGAFSSFDDFSFQGDGSSTPSTGNSFSYSGLEFSGSGFY